MDRRSYFRKDRTGKNIGSANITTTTMWTGNEDLGCTETEF